MLVVDPVCEMQIETSSAKYGLVYEQKVYWFCSEGCMAEFQRHPEDYVDNSNASEGENERV